MKKTLSLFSILVFFCISTLSSQTIGVGTNWIYNKNFILPPWPGDSLALRVKITADTLINNETFFVLKNVYSCGPHIEYLRIEDEKWFTFHKEEKHLLYDFGLEKGDTLKIINFLELLEVDSLFIAIDSTSTIQNNGISLKVQHFNIGNTNIAYWGNSFIEHVGSDMFIVPQFATCDPPVGGIKCVHYSDNANIEFDDCKIDVKGLNYFTYESKWTFLPWYFSGGRETVTFEIVRNPPAIGEYYSWEMVRKDNNGNIVPGSKIPIAQPGFEEKVFFLDSLDNKKLWFDFSYTLEVGDTVEYFIPPNANMYEITSSENIEVKNPYYYTILEIDNVVSDEGQVLRRWKVNPIVEQDDDSLYCNNITEIIEGIGPTNGFFFMNCTQPTAGMGPYFRCYSSEKINYNEIENNESCELVGTSNIEKKLVHIYPNPVRSTIIIDTEYSIRSIELVDMTGSGIMKQSGGSPLDISQLPNGLYYLRLTMKNGARELHRVLKLEE